METSRRINFFRCKFPSLANDFRFSFWLTGCNDAIRCVDLNIPLIWLFSDEAVQQRPIVCKLSGFFNCWTFTSLPTNLLLGFAHKALGNSNLMTFLRSQHRVTLIRSLKSTRATWNMLETGKKSYLIKNLASFKRFFSCSHQLTWRWRRTLPEKLQRWSGGKKWWREKN